jgi:hypothetical protein
MECMGTVLLFYFEVLNSISYFYTRSEAWEPSPCFMLQVCVKIIINVIMAILGNFQCI